jgi:hypothetical protein
MTKGTDKLPLEAYERQLDRIQQFFPRIDAKVSALFAVASAQIAIAAINLSTNDLKLWWVAVPLAAFLLIITWAMFNLYRVAYPHLDGGNASLVYFREIAKLRESDYISKLGALSSDEFKADLAGQVWRNSEIVGCKYRFLKLATISAMLSLIPWTVLLVATSLTHGRFPVVVG